MAFDPPIETELIPGDIDDILSRIPDNTANLIHARDVRDIVYTLWQKIEDIDTNINMPTYTTTLGPIPVALGGVSALTEYNEATMTQVFNDLFYPYMPPVVTFTPTSVSRAFGQYGSETFTVKVEQKSSSISYIKFNEVDQPIVVGANIAWTVTPSPSPVNQTEINVPYTVKVKDTSTNGSEIEITRNINFRNYMYWGTIDLGSLNLTLNPDATIPPITDAMINALSKELRVNKNKSITNFGGGDKHLIIVYPSNFGATASFAVNGLPNSAFKKAFTQSHTNSHGYAREYIIYISNTAQGSPLASVVVS